MTGLAAGRFLGLTGLLAPRVVVAASPQILKKPTRALRHFDRSEAEWRNLTPQMTEKPARALPSFRPKRSGVEKSHAPNDRKAGPRPPVISTEASQPPIGKPLIVQARGQLRLTWRLYAESPQSGEISPSDGTGGITVGDLQAQKGRFLGLTGRWPEGS